ncbi:hypothetical protein E2562_017486 [Oryza meyeriana var. granulata]|uniref:Uncharacterized protein n=1 Tax=Oryza meyeriana var. granulata TaxID=110450 RepID=A0A6G1DXT0_9ORYZ|nr:hypothetical protein E2562_017486 [Oryza meyeriana var. granulata]
MAQRGEAAGSVLCPSWGPAGPDGERRGRAMNKGTLDQNDHLRQGMNISSAYMANMMTAR